MALSTPMRSSGYEARLGLGLSGSYESNVFASEQNPQGDFGAVFSPSLRLSHEEKRLNLSAAYHPRYRLQSRITSRNQIFHQAALRADYTISPRTTLSLADDFLASENDVVSRFDVAEDEGGNVEIDRRTAKSYDNSFNLQLSHLFTPRFTGSASGFHRLRSYERKDLSDIDVIGANASLSYAFTPRSRFGLGGSFNYSSFSDTNATDAAVTAHRQRTIQGFLTWVYSIDPHTQFQLNGGPALIIRRHKRNTVRRYPSALLRIQDPDNPTNLLGIPAPNQPAAAFLNLETCTRAGAVYTPPCSGTWTTNSQVLTVDAADIPPGLGIDSAGELAAQRFTPSTQDIGNDEQLTFFGQVRLTRAWEDWSVFLQYRRTESPNSGLGATTQVDAVTLNTRWDFAKDWRSNLHLGYSHQATVGEVVSSVTPVYADSGVRGTDPNNNADMPVAELVGQDFQTTKRAADVDQFSADLSISRKLTRRLRATAAFRAIVRRSGSQVARRVGQDFEDYRVNLGFEYVFEPLHF